MKNVEDVTTDWDLCFLILLGANNWSNVRLQCFWILLISNDKFAERKGEAKDYGHSMEGSHLCKAFLLGLFVPDTERDTPPPTPHPRWLSGWGFPS